MLEHCLNHKIRAKRSFLNFFLFFFYFFYPIIGPSKYAKRSQAVVAVPCCCSLRKTKNR